MNQLAKELDRYLAIRRSLGFDLSTTATTLQRFIDFAEQQGAEHISIDLFLRWKKASGHASQQTWVGYLGIVRIFAQWLHGLDPANEVPPKGLIPYRLRRPKPYIYSEEEIRKIIETAAGLPSKSGMRALTHSTLFGLLAATGLRVKEALSLNNADVDLDQGVLTIRRGKGGKARLVPITGSVVSHLNLYIGERDRLLGFGRWPEQHRQVVSHLVAERRLAVVVAVIHFALYVHQDVVGDRAAVGALRETGLVEGDAHAGTTSCGTTCAAYRSRNVCCTTDSHPASASQCCRAIPEPGLRFGRNFSHR